MAGFGPYSGHPQHRIHHGERALDRWRRAGERQTHPREPRRRRGVPRSAWLLLGVAVVIVALAILIG
jgi:hypothetical protein